MLELPVDESSEDEVVLSLLFEPSSLLLLQEKKVKLKSRMIKRMMSICLTWFPVSGLGEPNIYHQSVGITILWGGLWKVSDLCRISGGYLETV